MTNRDIVSSLRKAGTDEDEAHSVKVTEHMRLNVPEAIILPLTGLTSTVALTRQLQNKSYLQQQMITQIPKDRLWAPLFL